MGGCWEGTFLCSAEQSFRDSDPSILWIGTSTRSSTTCLQATNQEIEQESWSGDGGGDEGVDGGGPIIEVAPYISCHIPLVRTNHLATTPNCTGD